MTPRAGRLELAKILRNLGPTGQAAIVHRAAAQGASAAVQTAGDILTALDEGNSDLAQIDAFFGTNPTPIDRVPGVRTAVRALIWSGRELTALNVCRLLDIQVRVRFEVTTFYEATVPAADIPAVAAAAVFSDETVDGPAERWLTHLIDSTARTVGEDDGTVVEVDYP